MYKLLFSAVLILAGATMAWSIVFADNNNAVHSRGNTANNGCPPAKWTALDLNEDGYANKGEVEKAAPCIDFDTVDSNGDGHFSRVEFLNFKEAKAKRKSNNANQGNGKSANNVCPPDSWTALDLNQDGYANEDEVAKAAPCIDFDTVDSSGDGDLSRVEFLNFKEGKSSATPPGNVQSVSKPGADQKLVQNQKRQTSGNAAGRVDQNQYDTPLALVTNVPKGKLKNPFDPHDTSIVTEGQRLFQTHGCSGCHGGDGGGGMCPPLTDSIWSYGDKPDTLYRLITLGTKKLQTKYGYTRNMMQTIQGDMPAVGPTFDNPEDIWKIITWIESMHVKN